MSEETLGQKTDACAGCPGCRLSLADWAKLCKPPLHKRHPVLFWGLLAVCTLGLIAWLFNGGKDDEGTERIALVSVTGPILDVSGNLEWIRSISHNPLVKGVLVRVDSPGGGAAASQELYAALLRLGKKMPVVVSMGAAAASGGLMVSMAGERIYANAGTVTGSIGVRMDIPQFQGLMQKLGIGQETLTTGPYKDATSFTRPMTPEDRAYLERLIHNMHEQFVDIVAQGRKMPREQVAALANGKVYTGQEALALGLIDELGGQEEAHDWIAQKIGIPAGRKLLRRPVSRTRIVERLLQAVRAVGLDLADLAALGEQIAPDRPIISY